MLPLAIFEEIEAVFFDAEGTLFQIHPSVGHIYARICKEYGLQVPPKEMEKRFREVFGRLNRGGKARPEECLAYWRHIFRETVTSFGPLDRLEEAFEKCYWAFATAKNFVLSPGAREVLASLRAQKKKLALVSNWDERLRHLVLDFGLQEFFDALIISCEVGYAKPDPTIYLLACQKLQIKPSKGLMIGDQLEDDVLAARRAGLWALRYPGGDLRRLFPKL